MAALSLMLTVVPRLNVFRTSSESPLNSPPPFAVVSAYIQAREVARMLIASAAFRMEFETSTQLETLW